jgi:tryptophan-rich sensory protein
MQTVDNRRNPPGQPHPGNQINRKWTSLVVLLAVCLGAELVAGLLTNLSVRDWYLTLRKPEWTPPGWLFGPVWTYLYLSMGVAAWLVWERRTLCNIRTAMSLFAIQLLLNVVWSGLFFGLQMPMIAFWEIVLLWLAILGALLSFWRIRRLAALLMIPYLVWVTYASALTLAIWKLNP